MSTLVEKFRSFTETNCNYRGSFAENYEEKHNDETTVGLEKGNYPDSDVRGRNDTNQSRQKENMKRDINNWRS